MPMEDLHVRMAWRRGAPELADGFKPEVDIASTVLAAMRLSERDGTPLEVAVEAIRIEDRHAKENEPEAVKYLRSRIRGMGTRRRSEVDIVRGLAEERARELCSVECYELEEAVAQCAEEIEHERQEARERHARLIESCFTGERLQRLADSIQEIRDKV